MKELSNHIKFLQGVSERTLDFLRPRKLQLKSDLIQERKNQSVQTKALKEEKDNALLEYIDETDRSKQKKLDQLSAGVDEISKSKEKIKNIEKETGLIYTGKVYERSGCLVEVLAFAVGIVLAIFGSLTYFYWCIYQDMRYDKERYRCQVDYNAYVEYMRVGGKYEDSNQWDKAVAQYESALAIEQKWSGNYRYKEKFDRNASWVKERLDKKKGEEETLKVDYNAYVEYMRVGGKYEDSNQWDKAMAQYESALAIEQKWSDNSEYGYKFDKDAYNALRIVEEKQYMAIMIAEAKSLDRSANCYIVSSSGKYKFRTVKGNSSKSLGSISSAFVLWESFGTSTAPSLGDLVKLVSYKDSYIYFQTSDTFKEGNAVIAAKDASGNILWSWHIWLTDQPQGQVYYKGAGTMMDRNLGATSATPGDVGAHGLLYQWGRKDPFLGPSSISSRTTAKSTISWPSSVSANSSRGTVSYVTANPTTFVTAGSSSDYDWHYSSRNNTLWTTSDKEKSIYDPCPAGWRVPDGGDNGVWSKALGSHPFFFGYPYDQANNGMNFFGKFGKFGSASTIWYPASGWRDFEDGDLDDVGIFGCYWAASLCSINAWGLSFGLNGYVHPSISSHRASGQSVRCLQE